MRILFGAIIILLGLLTAFSASRYKASKIQADIDGRTEERLASIEAAGDLAVDTDGRHVTLRGYAADEAEKEQIIESAEEVWGALGPIDEIDILEVATPYQFSAVKEASGRASLQGVVPNEAARRLLIDKAEEALGGEVDSDLTLAAGVPDGDWTGAVANGLTGLAALDHGRLNVIDDTIELTGLAPRSADVDRIDVLKSEAPEGFTWAGALDVEKPMVSPFTFAVSKADGAWQVEGHAPDEAARTQLLAEIQAAAGDVEVVADIQLADGMPGDDWQGFVQDRLSALDNVQYGTLRFDDYDVQLDGMVATLDDIEDASTAVAAIDPEIATAFEALDPTPSASLDLRLSSDDGVTVNGVLPSGLSKAEAAELLGLKAGYNGEISEDGRGDADAWRQDLGAIGGQLPAFETVDLSLKDGRAAIEGETHETVDAEQVVDELSDDLGARWQPAFAIQPTERSYADGATRINPLSGTDETYSPGFWLPAATLEAEAEAITQRKAEAEEELRGYQERINLAKSGLSARNATLDARARDIQKADERLTALRGDVETAEAEIERLDRAIAERGDADGQLAEVEKKLAGLRGEQATKLAILGTLAGKIERQRSLAEQDQQGLMTLRSGMETTEQRLGQRQVEIDRAEANLAELVADTERSEERLTALQQEIETSESTLAERRAAIEQTEKDAAALHEESETASATLKLRQGELEQIETSLASLRKERSEVQTMLAGLAEDRDKEEATKGDLAGLQKELDSLSAALEQREASLTETEGRLAENETALQQTEEVLTAKRDETAALEQRVEAGEQRLAEIETSATDVERQADEAAQRLAANDQEANELQEKIAALKYDEEKVRIMVDGLRARHEEQKQVKIDLDGLRVEAEAAQAERDEQVRLLEEQQRLVSDVESQLAELESQRGTLEQRVKAVDTQLGDKQATAARLSDVEAELAEKEAELANLNQEQATRLGLLGSLSAKLERQRGLGDEYAETEERFTTLMSDVETASADLADRRAAIEQAEQRLTALGSDIERAEGELETLEAGVEQASQSEQERAASVTEAEERLTSLQTRIDEAGQSEAAKTARLAELDADVKEAESSLEALRQERVSLDGEQAKLSASTEEMENEARAKLASLDEALADKTLAVEQRQASLSEAEERLAAVQSDLADADEALQDKQSRGETLESELTDLSGKVEEQKAALASAEQAVAAAEQAKAKAEGDLNTLQGKLTSAETGLAARMDEQSKTADEQKLAEDELKKIQADLEARRAANVEAAQEAETIEASIAKLTTAIETKRAEQQAAASELQSLRDESDAMVTALNQGRTELDSLIEEHRKQRDAIDQTKTEIAAATTTTTTTIGVDPLLTASPVQTDDGVRIAHLLFNYSSAELSPGAQRKVEGAASWIKENRVEAVRLVGYADAMGSSAKNQVLSQARADVAASALVDLGIDPEMITIEAVGDNVLVEATADQVSEPLNRSVGIFVQE